VRLTPTPLVLLCLLVSCASPDLDSFAQKNTARDERAFAENYLHLLSGAQLDTAAALLAPNLRTDTVAHALKAVSALLRDARLDSLHLVGVNVFTNAGTQSRDVNLSYQVVTTRGRWLSTNVATRSFRGDTSVIGFSAHILPGRLEEVHAFTLAGKSFVHYVWLVLAVLMPLVTIATAIRVIRAKGMPRRWLWALAALIASPAFTLNWTTGRGVMANNLFILFGGAFMRPGPAAPWLLTFAVPMGAFVAYLRLRTWRNVRSSPLSL
jgi:hypothetical protein